MAERADIFLHPRAGSDLVWLSAVTKYIIDKGWHDTRFLEERVNGFEEYVASLEPFTLEYAEEVTGIPRATLIRVAEAIRDADTTCVLWAMGVTQQQGGSNTSTAISNLLLVTGNYGRPGTGAYPLRGHNNRSRCERLWQHAEQTFQVTSRSQTTPSGPATNRRGALSCRKSRE